MKVLMIKARFRKILIIHPQKIVQNMPGITLMKFPDTKKQTEMILKLTLEKYLDFKRNIYSLFIQLNFKIIQLGFICSLS